MQYPWEEKFACSYKTADSFYLEGFWPDNVDGSTDMGSTVF